MDFAAIGADSGRLIVSLNLLLPHFSNALESLDYWFQN